MSFQIRVAGLVVSAIVASAASAQTAVEWKVSEGGNGHWYAFAPLPSNSSWNQAQAIAEAVGAHLTTVTSTQENLFVVSESRKVAGAWLTTCFNMRCGPLLGAFQPTGSQEPNGGWRWVTGEVWEFQDTSSGGFNNFYSLPVPNCACCDNPNQGRDEQYVQLFGTGTGWNDVALDAPSSQGWLVPAAALEWSADCNADGIVDYGQILRGELDDDNANGIPDVCETSVTGVIPPSVPSQGGSTVTIKGANFPENPTVLVGGIPATNVVRLSATRITATSPALVSGMTSITVNGFTLPDAIYIRPECGSDLDQNGTVDAGDISIILLDFGPCFEGLQADRTQSQDPPELLAAEPAPKPVTAK